MGNTFSPQAAQCGQLIEAYSVMVTVALDEPIEMSGSDTGFATCTARALCARAGVTATAAASATTAKQRRNAQRLMVKETPGRNMADRILGCGGDKDHGHGVAVVRDMPFRARSGFSPE